MDFDEFLDEVQKLITASQQGNLLCDKSELTKNSIELCVKFLRGQGYSIGSPNSYPIQITKLDELIATFYGFMRSIYPKQMWSCPNEKQDRAIAKSFVEARMEADGISRQTALEQCGLIVKTVFNRSDVFKFETAPTFGIFGQAAMAWVTERAVRLINDQIAKEEAIKTEKEVNEMTERIEKKYTNVGYSLDELTAMHKKLEGQHGKKEKR